MSEISGVGNIWLDDCPSGGVVARMQEISLEHKMLTPYLSSMVKSVRRVGGGDQERA